MSTITEHLAAMLTEYCGRHELHPDCLSCLIEQPLEDQHKAWLLRHQQRLDAAKVLDPYGFEAHVSTIGLGATRARLAFEDGARIIITSGSGSMLPTLADWMLMAFAADGSHTYDACSNAKGAAERLRAHIENARAKVDPTLLQPCGGCE